MKWIAIALLLANGVFFAWQMSQDTETPSAPVPPVSRADQVNRLLLLRELDASEIRIRVASQNASAHDRQETPGAATLQSGAPENSETAAATPRPNLDRCFSIGPITEAADGPRMRDWVVARGGQAAVRVAERRELALYWVYFPPLKDRKAAVSRVEELRGKGIKDIFVIARGDMANAVSLGVYSRRTSLERRLRDLKKRGYSPEVAPRFRTKKATWLDARFDADFEFPNDQLTLDFPAAQVSDIGCDALDEVPPGPAAAAPLPATPGPVEPSEGSQAPDRQADNKPASG